MVYLTLFFVAFLSGSLLPLGSEALLVYNIKQGYNIFLLTLFATIGNTLGALLNYYLGSKGEEFLEKRGYLKAHTMQKAKKRFEKFGGFALLLSPLPIIGDPITFIAGLMHYNFFRFIIIVFFAKLIRYILIAFAF